MIRELQVVLEDSIPEFEYNIGDEAATTHGNLQKVDLVQFDTETEEFEGVFGGVQVEEKQNGRCDKSPEFTAVCSGGYVDGFGPMEKMEKVVRDFLGRQQRRIGC